MFRDGLFIFCENRIFKLTGNSLSDFAVQAVTRNIGCINGKTIQEFAGDLLFLGPDGLRTVAGTANIGDVELGTISSNVQSFFDENISDATVFDSIVIPEKTQYRLFFKGIKPSCTDTLINAGEILILHGGFDGYIYRQEEGTTFNGTAILGKYRSPDLTMNDPGIRKHMQRVIVNFKPESTIDADIILRYANIRWTFTTID